MRPTRRGFLGALAAVAVVRPEAVTLVPKIGPSDYLAGITDGGTVTIHSFDRATGQLRPRLVRVTAEEQAVLAEWDGGAL